MGLRTFISITLEAAKRLEIVVEDDRELLAKHEKKADGAFLSIMLTGPDGKRRLIPLGEAGQKRRIYHYQVPAATALTVSVNSLRFVVADQHGRRSDIGPELAVQAIASASSTTTLMFGRLNRPDVHISIPLRVTDLR